MSDTRPDLDMSIEGLTEKREVSFGKKKFTVVCHKNPEHPSWWSHIDESATREFWWNVRPGDIVFDVGADFGSYSLPALALGAELVIAWSPPYKSPYPVEALGMKLSAWVNGFEDRLIINHDGLWSKRGWLASFDGPRPAKWFATAEEARTEVQGKDGYCSIFPVKTLDEYITAPFMKSTWSKMCGRYWMKIDTEGCELEILKGADKFLAYKRPKLLVENHPHVLKESEQLIDEHVRGLGLGYQKIGVREHGGVTHVLYVAN